MMRWGTLWPVHIVVADPTRRDLVERAVKQDLVAATNAEQRKETQNRDQDDIFALCS